MPYASSFGLASAPSVRLRDFVSALFDETGGVVPSNASGSEAGSQTSTDDGTGASRTMSSGDENGVSTPIPSYIFERAPAVSDGKAGTGGTGDTGGAGGAGSAGGAGGAAHEAKQRGSAPDAVSVLLAAARLPRLPAQFNLPVFRPHPPQFYLGPAGTGAPLHFHGDAFNALAHGRKRWWLFPPDAANYSITPASEWVRRVLPELCRRCEHHELPSRECPLVITQRAGDVLFVPRDWAHAVLNVQPSVGFAVEWDSPHSRSAT